MTPHPHRSNAGARSLAAAALLAMGLAACGGGGGGGGGASPAPAPAQAPLPVAPTEVAADAGTVEAIRLRIVELDRLVATSLPATGAQYYPTTLYDPCYVQDGRTRQYLIDQFDADRTVTVGRLGHVVGQTSRNVTGFNDRTTPNGDGTSRREVEVRWEIAYPDGTVARRYETSFVQGNTAPVCAGGVNSTAWRVFGNRRIAEVNVIAVNTRTIQRSIASGGPLVPAERMRRALRFSIVDPLGNVDYATVLGPGVGGSDDPTRFSIKLLSPRVLGSEANSTRQGTYRGWRPEDSFRICSIGESIGLGERNGDCGTTGANIADFGFDVDLDPNTGTFVPSQLATADTAFSNFRFQEGGTYLFRLYRDDGWRTINGQASRTPVAEYFVRLDRLPYAFADFVRNPSVPPAFVQNTQQIASQFATGQPGTLNVTTISLGGLPDARVFRIAEVAGFVQGPAGTTPAGSFFPAVRQLAPSYPGGSVSQFNIAVPPVDPGMRVRQQGQSIITYTDRTASELRFVSTYQ